MEIFVQENVAILISFSILISNLHPVCQFIKKKNIIVEFSVGGWSRSLAFAREIQDRFPITRARTKPVAPVDLRHR